MQILRGYKVQEGMQGGVLALGNFDGVHRGHRTVIEEAKVKARELGTFAGVLTFEPHPITVLRPEISPFRLTPFRSKMRLLEGLGIDKVFVIPFTRVFSEISAEWFVREILVKHLKVSHIVTGTEFVFGHDRRGSASLLHEMQGSYGYTEVKPQGEGEVFSSTRIRVLLREGKLKEAIAVLGHEFIIEGRVRRGEGRGRVIGFPTANVVLEDYLCPAFGVYRVKVSIEKGEWQPAIANLGKKPTFGGTEVMLETHLFNFKSDLYGRRLKIALLDYLRPERKFDSVEALRFHIEKDCKQARQMFQP